MVFGHAVGLTLIGLAWFLKSQNGGTVIPPSVLLIMSGIVILFAARYSYEIELSSIDEEWDDFDDLNYDSIYGDTSLFEFEEPDQATYSQWLLEKQEERKKERENRKNRRKKSLSSSKTTSVLDFM